MQEPLIGPSSTDTSTQTATALPEPTGNQSLNMSKSLHIQIWIYTIAFGAALVALLVAVSSAFKDPDLELGALSVGFMFISVGGPLTILTVMNIATLFAWNKKPTLAIGIHICMLFLGLILLVPAAHFAIGYPFANMFAWLIMGLLLLSLIHAIIVGRKRMQSFLVTILAIATIAVMVWISVSLVTLPNYTEVNAILTPIGTYTGGGTISDIVYNNGTTHRLVALRTRSITLPDLPVTHYYQVWLADSAANSAHYIAIDELSKNLGSDVYTGEGSGSSEIQGSNGPYDFTQYKYVVVSAEPLLGTRDRHQQTKPTDIILEGMLVKTDKNTTTKLTAFPIVTKPFTSDELTPVEEMTFEVNPINSCPAGSQVKAVLLIRSDVPWDWRRDSATGSVVVSNQPAGVSSHTVNEHDGQIFYLLATGTPTVLASAKLAVTSTGC